MKEKKNPCKKKLNQTLS